MPKLLTIAEAATELRIHPWTLYRLIRRGEIAAVKVGGQLRINADALRS